MWETQIPSLGEEDPLEKEMATHSSTVAWRIQWTEEPGGQLDTTEQLTFSLSLLTDSMDMNLSKLLEIMKDQKAWCAAVHGVTKNRTGLSDWTTEEKGQQIHKKLINVWLFFWATIALLEEDVEYSQLEAQNWWGPLAEEVGWESILMLSTSCHSLTNMLAFDYVYATLPLIFSMQSELLCLCAKTFHFSLSMTWLYISFSLPIGPISFNISMYAYFIS